MHCRNIAGLAAASLLLLEFSFLVGMSNARPSSSHDPHDSCTGCISSSDSDDADGLLAVLASNLAPKGGIIFGKNEQGLLDALAASDSSDAESAPAAAPSCTEEQIEGASNTDPASPPATNSTSDAELVQRLIERRANGLTGIRDKRGGYDRKAPGVGQRLTQQQYAWQHFVQAEENTLGNPCLDSCPFGRKCGRNISQAVLIRAHQRVYGTLTTRSEDGKKYSCAMSEAETHLAWR
eukprot:1784083-Pleurochrysis_carterae.AAC.1